MSDVKPDLQQWLSERALRSKTQASSQPTSGGDTTSAPEIREQQVEQIKPGFSAYDISGAGREAGESMVHTPAIPAVPASERIAINPWRAPDVETPEKLSAELDERLGRIKTAEKRIEVHLDGISAGDPEGVAAMRRRCERLTDELEGAYKEIAALRRMTAGVGKHPGARYYESMGQCLEMDAEGLLDLIDQHDLPEAVETYLQAMARNLSNFSMNCVAYAQTLS